MNRYQKKQAQYGLKKHISQMTEVEKEFLLRQFRAVNKPDWKITDYSFNRMTARGISAEHLMTIFDLDTELIEYHKKGRSSRILLRSKRAVNEANVCVVFEPETKSIVTVYLNYKGNKHEQLKLEFYDAAIDVIKQYKGGKS